MLTAIPTYVMQNTLLPSRILESLDRVTRNFVWGSTPDKRKIHMISRSKITKPREEGELKLQAAKLKNLTLLN